MKSRTGNKRPLISVHGGHSGEFCGHAADSLEDIVAEYFRQGFVWVGLTEHMPPPVDRFRYPEEAAAGLSAKELRAGFLQYMKAARTLQAAYRDRMKIAVGFETEWYTGSLALACELVRECRPDYVVGSVHHVHDRLIDFSPEQYHAVVRACGGLEELYCAYFDHQYELLISMHPEVVGHFDLVRIFDPGYRRRMMLPAVWERIERNLVYVAGYGGILDLNVRALFKGALEPYVSEKVLVRALELGIGVCPGDDSHGVDNVGRHIADALELLDAMEAPVDWKFPC